MAVIMGSRLQGGADLYGLALCVGGVLALTLATLTVRGATSGGNYYVQDLVGGADPAHAINVRMIT
ncbi:hypothetical protein, partial [Escherichia coli]|uniref:hypothetical protein n=1 Tax=Escherichia coli TaxID=562 RepID=UPI00193416CB